MGKKVHFLGIGGSGASAIAAIAQAQGFAITGCDKDTHNEFTTSFKKGQLFEDHSPLHLENIQILAVTPAIYSSDPENPELLAAQRRGIEILTWQEFMGKYLEKEKFVIAVCGTHGKSTTTAMLGKLLEDAKLDPTIELGAIVPNWGKNFRVGKSKYFVTEADEFNNNFLSTNPDMTILTTLEMDHPEFFKSFDDYKQSFINFLNQTKHTIIANLADPGVREVMEVYQKAKDNPHHPKIVDYSKTEISFPLKIIGEHNRLNATAVFQAGLSLGIDPTIIRISLMSFLGIGRRMEYLGHYKGADVYTDFGHHPTEIEVTIKAAREKFPHQRLVVIFQPHMFSRTKALFKQFVQAFKNLPADQIFLVDIYPSREKDTGLVSSKQLAEAIKNPKVTYTGSLEQTEQLVKVAIRKGDLVIFMGAGDIDKIGRRLTNG